MATASPVGGRPSRPEAPPLPLKLLLKLPLKLKPDVVAALALVPVLALSPAPALTPTPPGALLNAFPGAEPVPPGRFAFWWGLGLSLGADPELSTQGLMAQLAVRYGLLPRLDVGVGAGLAVTGPLRRLQPWAAMGDVRYQLLERPAISIGWTPPTFPLGDLLSGGAVYAGWPLGTLMPYGVVRALLRLSEPGGKGVALEVQGAVGLQIANPSKVPVIVELARRKGLWLVGFAARF